MEQSLPMSKQIDGPDEYWSPHLPPSRGQWKDIAQVACQLLGIPIPASRLDATTTQVRLRHALTENKPITEIPEQPWSAD
jgi:hypothetical protein